MKCDNCSNEAVYTHLEASVSPANYCGNCLPHWLQGRAIAGHFPLMELLNATTTEVKEPTTEEPVVENKPKKKAATKSTAVQE